MKMNQLTILLNELEKREILLAFEVMQGKGKVYLGAISKLVNVPCYVIKEYLLEAIKDEDYLRECVVKWDSPYITLHDTSKNRDCTPYAIFQQFDAETKKIKQTYVHNYICWKIIDNIYNDFTLEDYLNLKLQSHHIDLNRSNNSFKNLLPIPQRLHIQMHRYMEKLENPKEFNHFEYIQEYCTDANYLRLFFDYLAEVDRLERMIENTL